MNTVQNDPKSIFGRNFAMLLHQKNMSYLEAAHLIGIYRQRVPLIINGTQNFKLKTVIQIASSFNIAPFLLFSRLFDLEDYRREFTYVSADYMAVIRNNIDKQKSRYVDLHQSVLSQLISPNGKRNNPTISSLLKLAEGTGTTVSELLKTPEDILKEKNKGGCS